MDDTDVNGGDIDLDGSLLQRFSCLGTEDRDVLIKEFQRLLGPTHHLNNDGAAFFLDMNNWNLQAAICSYFDFEAPRDLLEQLSWSAVRLPSMTLISDITIGEGEAVPPDTKFTKTWRLQNSGHDRWPPGCSLRYLSGDHMSNVDRVLVDQLAPSEVKDVGVDMTSPNSPGMYQGQWRMSTPTGQYFGDVIWVIISVAEGGLLGLTQQMDSFHQLGSPTKTVPNRTVCNPFAPRNSLTEPIDEDLNLNNESLDAINSISLTSSSSSMSSLTPLYQLNSHLLGNNNSEYSANNHTSGQLNSSASGGENTDQPSTPMPPTPPCDEMM